MPTNPSAPNTNASVDRLALNVDSPRGTEPSVQGGIYVCFESEASGMGFCSWQGMCFEADPSTVYGCTGLQCFEGE